MPELLAAAHAAGEVEPGGPGEAVAFGVVEVDVAGAGEHDAAEETEVVEVAVCRGTS